MITWCLPANAPSLTANVDSEGRLTNGHMSWRDISGRRQSRSALLESEARLHAIVDNTTAVIYVKDAISFRYLLINRRFEELFGVKRKEIRNKTDYDLFSPEQAGSFRANDQRVVGLRSAIEFEEVAPHSDGLHTYISVKFPLLNAEGVPYAVCGISTDITARKRAEKALWESEQRFRQMAESINEVVWLTDVDGWKILYVNPAYEQITILVMHYCEECTNNE